jgi:hypothetical protein
MEFPSILGGTSDVRLSNALSVRCRSACSKKCRCAACDQTRNMTMIASYAPLPAPPDVSASGIVGFLRHERVLLRDELEGEAAAGRDSAAPYGTVRKPFEQQNRLALAKTDVHSDISLGEGSGAQLRTAKRPGSTQHFLHQTKLSASVKRCGLRGARLLVASGLSVIGNGAVSEGRNGSDTQPGGARAAKKGFHRDSPSPVGRNVRLRWPVVGHRLPHENAAPQ